MPAGRGDTAVSAAVPALLAGAAVAVAVGAPSPGALRLREVRNRQERGGADRHPGPDQPGGRRASGVGHPGRPLARRSPPALLTAAAALLLAGPAVAALCALVVLLAPVVLAARVRGRSRQTERGCVVEACGALAAELRAGRTPAEALAVAAALSPGPTGATLRSASTAAGWGGDVPAALRSGAADSAVPEVLRALAACWQVCATAGSGLAAAVDSVADGVRARRHQERAVAAALAGPRASAVLLALLPLVGTALAAGLGARPLHVLLHTPLGIACLLVGGALDLVGLAWTRALVSRAAAAAG